MEKILPIEEITVAELKIKFFSEMGQFYLDKYATHYARFDQELNDEDLWGWANTLVDEDLESSYDLKMGFVKQIEHVSRVDGWLKLEPWMFDILHETVFEHIYMFL